MAKKFEDFKFNRQILDAIAEAGYTEASPIQEKAITPILAGQDILGIAQTGTGKTAAFVLPIVMRLKYAQGNTARALILAPTRELAMQIEENIRMFTKYTDLRTVVIYGGLGPKTQIENIKKGVDILVATPGRFLDLYAEGHIATKQLEFLVMDEADKMMDMGFVKAIHRILEVVPRKRQNLLFSATMGELVQKIAGDFLKFPTTVEVAPQATPAASVRQVLYHVPNVKTKINLLSNLLDKEESITKLLIFCKTRIVADNIFKYIERKFGKEKVKVIHANKGQNSRINAMAAFKDDQISMLVATDVAARGIDVSEVSHVINFDVPVVIEDYVHRIGRTGRASSTGDAITFCNPAEEYYINKIEQLMRQKIPVQPLPEKVYVEETGYDERQLINKEIDNQKRKEDPDFKGAFHEKKHPRKVIIKKGNNVRGKGNTPKKGKGKKFK